MSETTQQSLPLCSAESEMEDDPFTAFARMLAASEHTEGQTAAPPKPVAAAPEKANKFEYEIDGDSLLATPSDSDSIAKPSEPGPDSDAMNKRLEALRAENERLRQ